MSQTRYTAGDWPEDAAHENGDYMNTCHACGERFAGHKRRVTCKVCAHQDAIQMAIADISSLTPLQFRAALEQHKDAPLALALQAAAQAMSTKLENIDTSTGHGDGVNVSAQQDADKADGPLIDEGTKSGRPGPAMAGDEWIQQLRVLVTEFGIACSDSGAVEIHMLPKILAHARKRVQSASGEDA